MPARKGYRTCVRCKRNRAERFFKPRGRVCSTCRKGRTAYASRAQRIEETYGITLDEYAEMLAAQGGACAICRGKRSYNLAVDHDHRVEQALRAQAVSAPHAARMSVRGLLCKQCNRRLLPAAHDNPEIFEAAIAYLRHWPSDGVLGAPL